MEQMHVDIVSHQTMSEFRHSGVGPPPLALELVSYDFSLFVGIAPQCTPARLGRLPGRCLTNEDLCRESDHLSVLSGARGPGRACPHANNCPSRFIRPWWGWMRQDGRVRKHLGLHRAPAGGKFTVCLRLRLPVASADIACPPREGRQQLCFASMKAECLGMYMVPLVQVLLREYSLSKKWTNLSSRTRFQTNNDGCLVVASFV